MSECNLMNLDLLTDNAKALCYEEEDLICCLSNLSSVIYHSLPEINWAGFYLMKNGELILGPFQGKPACTHIPLDKGVCGTAAQQKKVMRIADVHRFPGHIACDQASRSEIVIPLIKNDQVIGVLDIDAPIEDRFTEKEEQILSSLCEWISTLF